MELKPSSLAISLSILGVVLYLCQQFWKHRTRFHGLPQPPHHFLWGHLGVFVEVAKAFPPNTHPQLFMTVVAQKYNLKGLFYLDLWPLAYTQVIVCDPDLQHRVIANPCLPKHPLEHEFVSPIIGPNAMSVTNGATWKEPHRAMAPAVSMNNVKNLTGLFAEEVSYFCSQLDKHAETGEPFSITEITEKLVFEIIARMLLNIRLNAQKEPVPLLQHIKDMIVIAEDRTTMNPLKKFFNEFKRKAVLSKLNPPIEQKIRERFEVLKAGRENPLSKDPDSILDIMLRYELERQRGLSSHVKGTEEMSLDYVTRMMSNLKGLLAAGSGTTTATLSYAHMLMSRNPTVLQHIRDEHDRFFPADREATLAAIQKDSSNLSNLEYTDAVIKETLRLFSIGFGAREAKKGSTLSYEGQTYPIDNIAVAAPAHMAHYNPDCYPNPTAFRPERWINEDEKERSRYCFRGFGRGQRGCSGTNLAMQEMRIILLMTVRHYDFSLWDAQPSRFPRSSCTDLDTIYGDVVFQEMDLEAKPRGKMLMKVQKRSGSAK